jgi:NADH-quinone oxidoreductase subunit N
MSMDWLLFLPELVVLLAALATFVCNVSGASARVIREVGCWCALGAFAVSVACLDMSGEPFFPGIYRVDMFSQLLKLGLTLGLFLVLLGSGEQAAVRSDARPEVPFVLALATLGLMMLVSATELLTLYVALELSAYGLYILSAVGRHGRRNSEGAAKYVIFGAAASGITLYGISLMFGAAGTTYLAPIVEMVASGGATPMMSIGVLLTVVGFLFKLGAVPFHAWVPDVYESAPHVTVTFIGTASKLAAVGVFARATGWMVGAHVPFTEVLMVLCIASMTLGNLAAIAQKDLKRLLGWSTVAHAGYLLIGLQTLDAAGMGATIFYALTYLVIAFLPFLVVSVIGADGSNPGLKSLAGLHARSPFLAAVLLIGVFGLAGIPPTAGFAGKWFLFAAALEKGQFALVLIAAVNTTLALYYYLQLVRWAYLEPAVDATPIEVSRSAWLAGIIGAGIVLGVGFAPGPLWTAAAEAARALMAG